MPARQLGQGEDVWDDAIGGQVGRRPLGPCRAQELDESGVVHREERCVVVRDRRHLAGAGLEQRRADRERPGRHLGRRRPHSDPDLGFRLVPEAVVAPDERRQH